MANVAVAIYRLRPIQRQPEMAAETGNAYVSETMTGSVEISVAASRFSTMTSWINM